MNLTKNNNKQENWSELIDSKRNSLKSYITCVEIWKIIINEKEVD